MQYDIVVTVRADPTLSTQLLSNRSNRRDSHMILNDVKSDSFTSLLDGQNIENRQE